MSCRLIGVVGCGTRINSLLKYIHWNPDVLRIGAVCDPDRAKAQEMAAKLPGEVKIYDDAASLFADPSLDWVMIMTPNASHARLVIEAFAAGKHVFSEKPMAVSFAECLDIYRAWKASQKQYMIGFTLRYSPHYRKIREIVESGLIGRVVSMEYNENVPPEHGGHIVSCWRGERAQTGFHLLEKCCHDLDIANYILRSIPQKVASFGGLGVFTPENSGLLDRFRDEDGSSVYCRWPSAKGKNPFTKFKDIVDHQVCILEYRNHVRATFHTNIAAPLNERRIYLAGTCGTLRADAISGEITVRTVDNANHDFSTGEKGSHAGGDLTLMATLERCILDHTAPDASAAEGVFSAVAAFALDEAMTTDRVVTLDRYWNEFSTVSGESL